MDINDAIWTQDFVLPQDCRYYVKTVQLTRPDTGQAVPMSYIYVADSHKVPVLITHLQDYVTETLTESDPCTMTAQKRCYYFVQMLNYLFVDHHDHFKINSILQINKDMMQDFFSNYALDILSDNDCRAPEVIWRCVRVCTFTMRRIVLKHGDRMSLKVDDLIAPRKIIDFRGKGMTIYAPNFVAHGGSIPDPLLRDIPLTALDILITQAFIHTRDIVFSICLQLFAGLRPSEACNVRQECSPLGPGIRNTIDSTGHLMPEIDLRQELVLRSDGVYVGGIKKERMQKVYPAFLPAFNAVYEWHKKYLACHSFEKEFAPMFVDFSGKAMTYKRYNDRFKFLVREYFIPELLSSKDREIQQYGELVKEKGLGPHVFRHAFTVQLVLMGVSAAELMYWRGDHSLESAAHYIACKGDLMQQAKQWSSEFTQHIIELGRQGRV